MGDVRIVYEGGLGCAVTHVTSGVRIETEGAVENGGTGEGFSPTDLLAAAVGTCMVTAMGMVAGRRGIDIRGTSVEVTKQVVRGRMERMEVGIRVAGAVAEEDRGRLEAAARACTVFAALGSGVEKVLRFEWAAGL